MTGGGRSDGVFKLFGALFSRVGEGHHGQGPQAELTASQISPTSRSRESGLKSTDDPFDLRTEDRDPKT